MTPDWASLALSVGLCVAVAILEGFLTGSGLKDWYPRLRKPWWQIPLWASIAVGLIVYVIDGFVAYRVLTAIPSVGDRWVTLTALVVVMVLNALWNYAFFEYRSTMVGFLG
ncbi:MAG TPA: TspO/MBR family protein, partial [Rubrobacter sp.]|nr:TspO/MBR family protein [Rubrobacter sp.]